MTTTTPAAPPLLALILSASLACAPSPAGEAASGTTAEPEPGTHATDAEPGAATAEPEPGAAAAEPDPAATATAAATAARLGDARPLPSPAGPQGGEPNLHTGPDDHVYLSWIEAAGTGHALRFSTLDQGAPEAGWSAPRTIAASDGFFVNWADFPSLVALEDGTLVAHWLQREGEGYAYGIRISRSGDGGATWSEPVTPHHDGTLTEHGFVSLVPEPGGGFTAVWLDGRDFADAEPAAGGQGGGGGEMSLRASTFAPDGTQGTVHLVDSRICECCQTSAARVDGELLVVYRDRSPEEIRDISAVTRGPDGWNEPVRLARDGWQIPGCPVNGPAVAGRDGRAAVAWFSLREGRPEVKLTFTDDAGRTFSDPILVHGQDTPGDAFVPLGRVDVAWLDDRTAVVTWLAGDGGDAEVRALPVTVGGATGEAAVITATRSARSSGFPRIASAGGRLVVAWTEPAAENGTARVRTAVLPILGPDTGPAGEAPER